MRRMRWLLALILLVCGFAGAQTITVHLINAKNGKPIAGKNITVDWPDLFDESVAMTDKSGVARISVPKGQAYFSLREGPRVGKEPNRVAYFDCNARDLTLVSVSEVMDRGFVPRNDCSKKTYSGIKPGEIVFYAELIPWWMPDMQ